MDHARDGDALAPKPRRLVITSLAELERSASVARTLVNACAVVSLLGICGALAVEIVAGAEHVPLGPVIPAIIIGYLAADLVSGIAHYLADNFGSIHAPLIGPLILRRFREHHVAPEMITRLGLLEVNGANSLFSLPVAAVLLAFAPIREGGIGHFVGVLGLTFLLGVFLTNQFHRWAHLQRRPGWLRALQASGLILSPVHHEGHHAAPFRRRYCITSGILNPLLDHLRIFERFEGPLARVLTPWLGEPEEIRLGEPPTPGARS